jgi:hypothetical protein
MAQCGRMGSACLSERDLNPCLSSDFPHGRLCGWQDWL